MWLILTMPFRSVRMGFVALLPNLLPVIAYFALLGALGISLNLTTSLVACAVFGIAIDDSVHLMTRFRMAVQRRSQDPVADALRHTLYPISLTTLALAAGFLTLTQAELASQGEFGVLAADPGHRLVHRCDRHIRALQLTCQDASISCRRVKRMLPVSRIRVSLGAATI